MAVKKGDTIKVHYTGTLTDGTEFDSSHKRNEPLQFNAGEGQMIQGFDKEVIGMEEGDTKTFTIPATEAYGEVNEEAVMSVPKTNFPSDFDFVEGQMVQVQTQQGQQLTPTISEIQDTNVVLDFNHPLAGKDLTFDIELVQIV
mgnify:CR=1 FL=1